MLESLKKSKQPKSKAKPLVESKVKNKTKSKPKRPKIIKEKNKKIASKQYLQPPDLIVNLACSYKAVIKTSMGDMTFKLFLDEAPITVNNFVYLSRDGFYKNNQFHRIVSDFIVQGGCPDKDGTGSVGYKFKYEDNYLDYHYGMLAMISADNDNKGGQYTNGSQFFIVHGKHINLFKKNTIFGQLIDGEEVLDSIAAADVVLNKNELSKPMVPIDIKDIEIIEENELNYDAD